MPCKYCGESDPYKLTMSTRIINDKAITTDVCFNCYYREKFEAEVMGNMGDGRILPKRKADRESFRQRKPSAAGLD